MSEALIPYIAYHGWVYLKNAINSHQFGLRVQFKLDHEDDFKDFKKAKKHRKNRAGSGTYQVLMRMEGNDDWEDSVDMMFITWSLSPTNGATITFEMSDQDTWEDMRSLPALSGQDDFVSKIEVMMIELDDEGKPVDVKQRAKMERMAAKKKWPKGGPRSKQAARLCQSDDFKQYHMWLCGYDEPANNEEIANWFRHTCDIDSRAQLDHDPAALQRFEDKIISPFLRSQM